MPEIVILSHQNLYPDDTILEAGAGEAIPDVALRNGIETGYACEESCICTTCHCIVRKGFDSLSENTEEEDDALNKIRGLKLENRLSCQTRVTESNLVVEIPHYTTNHTRGY